MRLLQESSCQYQIIQNPVPQLRDQGLFYHTPKLSLYDEALYEVVMSGFLYRFKCFPVAAAG